MVRRPPSRGASPAPLDPRHATPPAADDDAFEYLPATPPVVAAGPPQGFQPDQYPWVAPPNRAALTGILLMPYLFDCVNIANHLPVDAGLDLNDPIRWLGFDTQGGLCVPIRLIAAIAADLLAALVNRQRDRVAHLWNEERMRHHAAIQHIQGEDSFLTDTLTRSLNALHWAEYLFQTGDDGLGSLRAGETCLNLATRSRRRRVPLAPYTLPTPILRQRESRERALINDTVLRVAACPNSEAVGEVMGRSMMGIRRILE